MKKRLQGLIAGVLIGATITGGVVFAANTTTLYNVIANGIKIVVDGQKLNPTDVNGNRVEPIIYNGTTYLPVRAVANALGKAVYWDGPNYTVYLGQAPTPGGLPYPTVELEKMTSINHDMRNSDELTDNYGNKYARAVEDYISSYKYEFLLSQKYSRFKGTLYVPKGAKSDKLNYLKIIADGKTIYISPEMTRASAPVNIDVNVTGYNDIKIEFAYEYDPWFSNLPLCIGDAGFYQ